MKPTALLLLPCLLLGCSKPQESAVHDVDLAVINARIWTGDPQRPWAEALSANQGKIVAVGNNDEIARAGTPKRTIDARGRLIVPGFIDSHLHFIEGGQQLASVQLRDARSREQLVARIKEFVATLPPDAWLTGGGWDNSLWGGELPTREWIDAVTGDRPAWLSRVDGHMALANSAALRLAGVDRNTPDVPGGEIVRDANGEPTGALKDNAMALVERIVPPLSAELRDRALDAAMRYANERGVTSVHSLGSWEDLDTFDRAADAGRLTVRIYGVVPLADWEQLRDRMNGDLPRSSEWLRIGGLKGYVDGSLGSRTAAMLEPFEDAPNARGLLVNAEEDLYRWISGADKAGLHVMVHAIGDRANRILLDIYERVAAENGPRDRRMRIEHVQHLAREDIARFGRLGVIASMQPYHVIDDGRWAERYIGERITTSYAYRDLLDTQARLAFGSDWPVAPATPLEGIYAAVTRRTLSSQVHGLHKRPGTWFTH